MSSFNIDFTADDFARYYGDTLLLLNGAVFQVGRVEMDVVHGAIYKLPKSKAERLTVPLRSLMSWDVLKPPVIGWASLGNGPAYLRRLPLRQITKGTSPHNVRAERIPWWGTLLLHLDMPPPDDGFPSPDGSYTPTTADLISAILEHAGPEKKVVAEEVKSLLAGDKLFSVLSPRAMICLNPYSKKAPIIGFSNDVMIATYDDSGTLKTDNTSAWEEAIYAGK